MNITNCLDIIYMLLKTSHRLATVSDPINFETEKKQKKLVMYGNV